MNKKKQKQRQENERKSPAETGDTEDVQLQALKAETEKALIDTIRALLKLPMNQRTNFLRVRRPGGGSCV